MPSLSMPMAEVALEAKPAYLKHNKSQRSHQNPDDPRRKRCLLTHVPSPPKHIPGGSHGGGSPSQVGRQPQHASVRAKKQQESHTTHKTGLGRSMGDHWVAGLQHALHHVCQTVHPPCRMRSLERIGKDLPPARTHMGGARRKPQLGVQDLGDALGGPWGDRFRPCANSY